MMNMTCTFLALYYTMYTAVCTLHIRSYYDGGRYFAHQLQLNFMVNQEKKKKRNGETKVCR